MRSHKLPLDACLIIRAKLDRPSSYFKNALYKLGKTGHPFPFFPVGECRTTGMLQSGFHARTWRAHAFIMQCDPGVALTPDGTETLFLHSAPSFCPWLGPRVVLV